MYFSYSNNETCLMAVIYLFFSWIAHAIRCEQWSREKEIQFMWFYRFSRSQFSFLISLIFSSVVFFFPSNDNFLKIYTSSYGPQHSLVFHLLTMVYKQLNGHFKCFINIALKQQQKKMHIRSLSFIHSCVSNARRKKKTNNGSTKPSRFSKCFDSDEYGKWHNNHEWTVCQNGLRNLWLLHELHWWYGDNR